MTEDLLVALAPLGSMLVQRLFMVHATRDQYLEPDEVWEAALQDLQRALQRAETRATLTDGEIADIVELLSHVAIDGARIDYASVPWDQLVEKNTDWGNMRGRVHVFLQKYRFPLEQYENRQLTEYRGPQINVENVVAHRGEWGG